MNLSDHGGQRSPSFYVAGWKMPWWSGDTPRLLKQMSPLRWFAFRRAFALWLCGVKRPGS